MSEKQELVLQTPREELLCEIEVLRNEKQVAEKAKDLKEREELIKRCEYWQREQKKLVYEESFFILVEKYFGLDRECLEKLDQQKLDELEQIIYEKAKRQLRWKKPLVFLLLLIPIFGWFGLAEAMSKKNDVFPTYKFVVLRDWYKKNFGSFWLKKAREENA